MYKNKIKYLVGKMITKDGIEFVQHDNYNALTLKALFAGDNHA